MKIGIVFLCTLILLIEGRHQPSDVVRTSSGLVKGVSSITHFPKFLIYLFVAFPMLNLRLESYVFIPQNRYNRGLMYGNASNMVRCVYKITQLDLRTALRLMSTPKKPQAVGPLWCTYLVVPFFVALLIQVC